MSNGFFYFLCAIGGGIVGMVLVEIYHRRLEKKNYKKSHQAWMDETKALMEKGLGKHDHIGFGP